MHKNAIETCEVGGSLLSKISAYFIQQSVFTKHCNCWETKVSYDDINGM
jgi:hypothetical protein